MKHIEFAWIEQVITFDSPEELKDYLDDLNKKMIPYSIMKRGNMMLRIRKQYNKNNLLRRG